jgi:geranylgeranyl diphosphate synthase type II
LIHLKFIKSYASLIEKELQDLELPPKPSTLYDPQRYILAGKGKRVRPVLSLLACGLCGGKPEQAIHAGLAVELIHNFTLIHDDIMDQAESRRGNQTVHKKWDLSTGILSGDGMFVQACLQLQKMPAHVNLKQANEIFLNGINHVCEGQALDMEFEERNVVETAEYLEMIGGKTAALISVSLMLGALAAGADDEEVQKLDQLGRSLGLAFQIQDDLLDVVADPEKFGKKQGGDIFEGKKTFLMLRTLEACTEEERSWLLACMNSGNVSPRNVEEVISLYQKYEITGFTKSEVDRYYSEAEQILFSFDDSVYKQDLNQLITFLKNREF